LHKDYVNKRVVCPTCKQNIIVFIDLNELKKDFDLEGGIVKRSLHHENHLLILDIDFNGDVRTIIPITDDENISFEDLHTDPFFMDIADFEKIKKNIVLVSESPIFSNIFANQFERDIKGKMNFDVSIRNKYLLAIYHNLNIHWIRTDKILTLESFKSDVIIIDLENMSQEQLQLIKAKFISLDPKNFRKIKFFLNYSLTDTHSVDLVNVIKTKINGDLIITNKEYKEKVDLLKNAIEI